jgi:alkanesulfonate monooxygenase
MALNTVVKSVESSHSKSALGHLKVFSTSPQSLNADKTSYLAQLGDVARWSERAGCSGILVYTDNGIVDPWLVAQVIIENTATLAPLVAVQPVYMHPYSVAKMVATFSFLYGRKVYLNMVAGGFTNDLIALNDHATHDERYERLIEYSLLIKELAESQLPVTFQGKFYQTDKLTLRPAVPAELRPGIFVSGSSPAGMAAAVAIGATAVRYPGLPTDPVDPVPDGLEETGIRIGVIAREDRDSAWSIAHQRFPSDRKGQLTRKLAMRVSDSSWHRQLSELAADGVPEETYWLGPFENSKSNCPYLVGDYEAVAAELRRYIATGYSTFILDIPPSEEDLHHTGVVFKMALADLPAQVL